MNVHLHGQVALVTGAARGIGQAIADALAANGARVAYADIDLETARAAAAQSPGALALRLDVTNEAEIDSALAEIGKRFGRLDILVNCLAPGSILTEGTRQLFYGADGKFSDRVQAMLAHIPLGRPGTCAKVTHAVLFLAAPESSYINGAVLTVDGGWLAGYIRQF